MSAPSNAMKSVSTWKGGGLFEHAARSGIPYTTDAKMEAFPEASLQGPGPMEVLLGALSGCAGIDVVAILTKMRMRIRSMRIEVDAERRPDHPRIFTKIHMTYDVATDPPGIDKVKKAVELSGGKYCSVAGVLGASAEIAFTIRHDGQERRGVLHGEAGAPPSLEAAVELPVTGELDLHAFHPRDVAGVVGEYLLEAARKGLTEVRVVHGKGTGQQREIVKNVLEAHPAVASFRLAPADRGHWGATIVSLRRTS